MNKITNLISCFFGHHDLEVREKEIPWTSLYKRERCRRRKCNHVTYYYLGSGGGWQKMWQNPRVNFDRLGKYCKEVGK